VSRLPFPFQSPRSARPTDVDVAALLRAQAEALRAQAAAIDAQAQVLETHRLVTPRAAEPAPLLSKQQLATALGVSSATIDRLCRERAIPFLTVGDSRRFDLVSVRLSLEAPAVNEPAVTHEQPPGASPSGVRLLSRRTR